MFYADTTQGHFAYNVSLDCMNEKSNYYYCEAQDILEHNQKSDQTIHLKIEWAGGEKSWKKLDVIKYHSTRKILEYLIRNNLIDMPGYKWVHIFVEADIKLMSCRRAWIESRKDIRFKFEVKVTNNPKHTLELDLKEGINLWTEAIKAELDQNNDYKTFRV